MTAQSDKPNAVLDQLCTKLNSGNGSIDLVSLADACQQMKIQGHLAILNGKYIDKILAGKKTIESRFSKMRVGPFGKVEVGDVLFLKQSSGPLKGLARVGRVQYFGPLVPDETQRLMKQYQAGLQLEAPFIEAKQSSRYASLLHIVEVCPVKERPVVKTDRRAWVTLNFR